MDALLRMQREARERYAAQEAVVAAAEEGTAAAVAEKGTPFTEAAAVEESAAAEIETPPAETESAGTVAAGVPVGIDQDALVVEDASPEALLGVVGEGSSSQAGPSAAAERERASVLSVPIESLNESVVTPSPRHDERGADTVEEEAAPEPSQTLVQFPSSEQGPMTRPCLDETTLAATVRRCRFDFEKAAAALGIEARQCREAWVEVDRRELAQRQRRRQAAQGTWLP